MPREYTAHRMGRHTYSVFITIRTPSGDEMHEVRSGIKNVGEARRIVNEFNKELGVTE